MKILVFGATGRTGRCLIEQALAAGHEVTAFARNPALIAQQHERLRVVKGDALDPAAVEAAVAGQDAVISALGTQTKSPGATKPPPGMLTAATRNIIAAMEKQGVRRFICQSTAGVGDSKAQPDPVLRWIIQPLIMKDMMKDKADQEALIENSNLDWVIVRPVHMTEGPARGAYKVVTDGSRIPTRVARADVATFMLEQLASDQYVGKRPSIGG
jgi:putative NADH-flavin reductase